MKVKFNLSDTKRSFVRDVTAAILPNLDKEISSILMNRNCLLGNDCSNSVFMKMLLCLFDSSNQYLLLVSGIHHLYWPSEKALSEEVYGL